VPTGHSLSKICSAPALFDLVSRGDHEIPVHGEQPSFATAMHIANPSSSAAGVQRSRLAAAMALLLHRRHRHCSALQSGGADSSGCIPGPSMSRNPTSPPTVVPLPMAGATSRIPARCGLTSALPLVRIGGAQGGLANGLEVNSEDEMPEHERSEGNGILADVPCLLECKACAYRLCL
jgi:hypothetical protein